MDNLDKLDFDVSYNTSFSSGKANLIDVYVKDAEVTDTQKEEDKLISFSAALINCFKNKVKNSSERLRVDSLIATYKDAGETYNKEASCTLGEWCMAHVNRFLSISERKDFILDIEKAKQDLIENNLKVDFDSVDQLYIETRKEAVSNAIASHWMEI
jgi:hypothetical protein